MKPQHCAAGLAAWLLLSILSACAGEKEWRPSGFLGSDYSDYTESAEGYLVYRRPGADLSSYDKILLDRVEIWLDEDTRTDDVPWPEIRYYARSFEKALADALQGAYPLVEEPGEGVLELRVALTDVDVSVHGYSTRENLGYGDPYSVDDVSFETTRLDVNEIAVEAEFLDSSTGERLAAVLARRSSGAGSRTKWDAVQAIFNRWAQGVRQALDNAHGAGS